MVSLEGGCKMPCESCAVQFSVFRRKRACSECERFYCSACLRRGGGICSPCRTLSTRPLSKHSIAHLKVRDLQCFLQRQNVSTRGCVEKEELVSLCVAHVNSSSYRRRGPRAAASGPFTTLKGFTNNINDFLNNAFDIRQPPPQAHPQPPPPNRTTGNCYNAAHAHGGATAPPPPPRTPSAPPDTPHGERFTTRPGDEPDIFVPVPEEAEVPRRQSTDSLHRDTADCFEIEDLADSGWEVINRPAEPLPNDSEVLMTTNNNTERVEEDAAFDEERIGAFLSPEDRRGSVRVGVGGYLSPDGGTPQRAASELNLHRSGRGEEVRAEETADTGSLQDEPLMHRPDTPPPAVNVTHTPTESPKRITLESMESAAALESLNVKQLKELLTRNRVEYRGCLERAELLERARMLWHDHNKLREDLDNLPLEECCKICMAAPLECVLLECGHIAACTDCAKQLAECPICRQFVVRAVRFFRS